MQVTGRAVEGVRATGRAVEGVRATGRAVEGVRVTGRAVEVGCAGHREGCSGRVCGPQGGL